MLRVHWNKLRMWLHLVRLRPYLIMQLWLGLVINGVMNYCALEIRLRSYCKHLAFRILLHEKWFFWCGESSSSVSFRLGEGEIFLEDVLILARLIEVYLILLFLRGELIGLVIGLGLNCEILSNIVAFLYSFDYLREGRPKS